MGLGNFMHLLGGKPKGAKPAANTAPKGAAKRAEVPPEGDDEDNKAEGDDEGEDPDNPKDDDAASDDPKDDEAADGDEEEDQAALIARVRREAVAAERKRCAKIFGHKAAGNNVAQACQLAFGTNLSADRVIAIMGTAAPARGGGLAAVMGSVDVPVVRGGGSTGGGNAADRALSAAIDREIKNRGGK